MNFFYFKFAGLFLLLLLLFKLPQNAARMIKATVFFLIIFLVAGFTIDYFHTGKAASGLIPLKNWLHSTAVHANAFPENYLHFPIVSIKDQVLLNVPAVSQNPELPRGCEVTSLAMLLNDAGIKVSKIELAKQVKKDATPQTITNGRNIHFGNPNDGFVGSMDNTTKPGLGVYHKPIASLAEKYLPGNIIDLTGSSFQELKLYLSEERPIWVITNITYKKLKENQFQIWNTPSGETKITYKEHSVLLTGYDPHYIYFNDPLTGQKNKKAPIKDFEQSWVQMGSQAITFLPRY